MCVFHGEDASCEFCEAPLQLEALYDGDDPDALSILNPALGAPSLSHISGILSGNYWSSTNVSFGFTTSKNQYLNSEAPNGEKGTFKQLSDGGKAIFRDAMSQWDEVSGLTLSEAGDPASAELRIAGSNAPTTAWAYYPTEGWGGGGDIWANTTYIPAYKAGVGDVSGALGTYAHTTAMHEVGHALGMEHPHDGSVLTSSYDSIEYSVMSYKSFVGHTGGGYTNEAHGFAQSLMMLDIAAIQSIYGADYSTRSGDTTYSFDPNTGEMLVDGSSYAAPAQNRVFRTIWDGDGFDTLDFALYTTDIRVDLNPGAATDLDVGGLNQRARLGYASSEWVYASAHVYMSLLHSNDDRSLVESVVCGSGNDVLIGNAADNLLCGGLGLDTYTLGAGSDIVRGTLAEIVGDLITDFGAEDQVIATDLAAGQNIEIGGDGVIRLVDGGPPDEPDEPEVPEEPADPDDEVATDGIGVIRLTERRDSYKAVTEDDLVVVGLGDKDRIETGEGNDRLIGQDGNDALKALGGDDTLEGGNGKDKLDGGTGNDILLGGEGRDNARGRSGHDTIFGGSQDDSIRGDEGNDRIAGQQGDDRLDAGSGDDLIYGGEGNDRLSGKSGNDTLYGGAGDDILNGSDGADIYVFHAEDSGFDTIARFVNGEDKIEIDGFAGSFDDLSLTEVRKGVMIEIASGVEILVRRADVEDFGASDFLFYTGVETDRDLSAVALADVVDPGGAGMELSDGADELRLSLKNDLEIDLRDGDDKFSSGKGDDTIEGGTGDDTIRGGSGDDLLIGGAGADELAGGGGNDVFLFEAEDIPSGASEFDVIKDFRWKNDTIRLIGFKDDSVEDLDFSISNKKAQIVIDGQQTIWFNNMRDHDDFVAHDLIEFL